MFTRRMATVIISAPDASCAFTITAGDEYLPVPTMRRDENDLSAMVRRSTGSPSSRESQIPNPKSRIASSASDEVDDLDLVALADDGCGEGLAFEHDEVVLDRDA